MGWFWPSASLLSVSISALYRLNESSALPRGPEALFAWRKRLSDAQSYVNCDAVGGLGNTLTAVISSGILGLYFNKPVCCPACDPEFFHFPDFNRHDLAPVQRFPDIPELYDTSFSRDDPRSFEMWFFAPDHLYLHNQIGSFLYATFGEYATYYLGNYFFNVPSEIQTRVQTLLAPIPSNVISIGIHIRTHFGSHPAFMMDAEGGCGLIAKFIASQFTRPTQVVLATDSDQIIQVMRRLFPTVMRSGVDGFPDGEVSAAVVDFFMLESCEELILTFRSTFSLMAGALANKTGYCYADEWPVLVRFTGSQLGMTSGVFQAEEPYNDKTNTKHHMLPKHETTLRLFNRYFVV